MRRQPRYAIFRATPQFSRITSVEEYVMKFKQLTFSLLIGLIAVSGGCGGGDTGGTGGTLATGGTGGSGGSGGTGGTDADPCLGKPACIVCPEESLPPDLVPFLPGGIRTPVDFMATPEGDVVQGGMVTINVEAEIVVALPLPAQGAIDQGSTSTYVAAAGGDGALDITIPEQSLSGQELVIDGGSASGEFTVDADTNELVIGLDSVLVNLSVTDPVELALVLDASATGGCRIEGEGVIIPVSPAE